MLSVSEDINNKKRRTGKSITLNIKTSDGLKKTDLKKIKENER